jgi:hypothetical protein
LFEIGLNAVQALSLGEAGQAKSQRTAQQQSRATQATSPPEQRCWPTHRGNRADRQQRQRQPAKQPTGDETFEQMHP